MLTLEEIKRFISEDKTSKKKREAKEGLRYYESEHDILNYKVYYINSDGNLEEDKSKTNMKIPHSFFSEIVDQKAQYMLSKRDGFIKSKIPQLQEELDKYFDDEFTDEIEDLLTYGSIEGASYLYNYKNEEDSLAFNFTEMLNLIEVDKKEASDKQDHIIHYYNDKIRTIGKKKDKEIVKIQVWDKDYTYYYVMADNQIKADSEYNLNPRPHILYNVKGKQYYDTFGYIPFFKFSNNKKEISDLKPIKALIDDYDLMACGLSNNIQDLSEGYYVVKGFDGDNLDELSYNVKNKKIVGVSEDGDLDIKTVAIPYDARKQKMELDEKNIYRFGMAFNSSQIGDGNITNIVIKSRYALLDLKCNKCENNLRALLKKVVKVVLDEINERNETAYTIRDIYFDFEREVMTNASDNAQIKKTEAETKQIEINTILNVATQLPSEEIIKMVCEVLDIDYAEIESEIKQKLEDEKIDLNEASDKLINEETPLAI